MLSLLDQVADTKNLTDAFFKSRKASWSPSGYMGRQYLQVARNWTDELRTVQASLLDGTYTYQGADAVLLQGRKKRGVYAASVRDRWVQHAIYQVIKDCIPPEYWSDASYGRPASVSSDKRSVRSLAHRVSELVAENRFYVYETDIEEFFPTIEKSVVVSKVVECIGDDSLQPLLEQMVSTEITRFVGAASDAKYRSFWNPDTGVPQGGVLSPMFANIYLNDFDKWVEAQGWTLFRYMDDLLVFCEGADEAIEASSAIPEKLGELKLVVHPLHLATKSFIREPGNSVVFVGLSFKENRIKITDVSRDRLLARVGTLCLSNEVGAQSLVELLTRVNNLLEGWMAAYHFCDLPAAFLRELDKEIAHHVGTFAMERGILKKSSVLQNVDVVRALGLRQLADLGRMRFKVTVEDVSDLSGLEYVICAEDFDMFTANPTHNI